MNIPLNIVQIYTNVKENGKHYYNLSFTTKKGNKYSISTSLLFINTDTLTIFLKDEFEYKVYDYNAKMKLSDNDSANFIGHLKNSNNFKTIKELSEEKQEKLIDNSFEENIKEIDKDALIEMSLQRDKVIIPPLQEDKGKLSF